MKIQINGQHVILASESPADRDTLLRVYFNAGGTEAPAVGQVGVGRGKYTRTPKIKLEAKLRSNGRRKNRKTCDICGFKGYNIVMHKRGKHEGMKIGWHRTGINPALKAKAQPHPELIEA